jgi:hypothetical protein
MAEPFPHRGRTLILAILTAAAGVCLAIGPGDGVHHELHKLNLPVIGGCCCADATHSTCGWTDHFGHPWSGHRKVVATGRVLVVMGLAVGVLSVAARWLRRRVSAGACSACGYDLRGTLPFGIARCPECGRPAAI